MKQTKESQQSQQQGCDSSKANEIKAFWPNFSSAPQRLIVVDVIRNPETAKNICTPADLAIPVKLRAGAAAGGVMEMRTQEAHVDVVEQNVKNCKRS